MERYQCPACGAKPYSGGRCRSCCYTPFTEEVAHRNHYDAGEPLVLRSAPRETEKEPACNFMSSTLVRWGLIPLGIGVAGVGALFLAGMVPGLVLVYIIIGVAVRAYLKERNGQ